VADKWIWIAAAAGGAFVLYEYFKPAAATTLQVSPFAPMTPSPTLSAGSVVTGPIGANPNPSACGAGTVWDAGSQTCIQGPILPPPPIHPPVLPVGTCTTPECAQPPNIPGLHGLEGCYEWTKSCFAPPDACGDYGGPQASCAATVTWYWVLAGAAAAALVLARLK
jgi:hypothetical protein